MDWIEAALPQQNRNAAGQCTVEIQVTGTGAGQIKFATGQSSATIRSDAPALVRWITGRGDWTALGAGVTGGEQARAVARTLKVL